MYFASNPLLFLLIEQEKEQKKQQQMMIRAIESQRKQEVGGLHLAAFLYLQYGENPHKRTSGLRTSRLKFGKKNTNGPYT